MTKREIEAFTRGLAPVLRERLAAATKPLLDRIVVLEARAEKAERLAADLRYRGVWREGVEYQAGNFVTSGGSMWHCNEALTKSKPGEGTGDWTLCVVHGRDAKAPRP